MFMRENKETYPEQQQFSGNNNKEGITPIILAVLSVILLLVCYTWILQYNFSRNTLETAVERNTLRMDTIYQSMIGVLKDDDFRAINVQDDRQATRNAGMNAHLSKPLDGKEVLRVISKCSRK